MTGNTPSHFIDKEQFSFKLIPPVLPCTFHTIHTTHFTSLVLPTQYSSNSTFHAWYHHIYCTPFPRPNGKIFNCGTRIENARKRNIFIFYRIGILWFIPLTLLLFTYTSVSVSLIRSIRQTYSLAEDKRYMKRYKHEIPFTVKNTLEAQNHKIPMGYCLHFLYTFSAESKKGGQEDDHGRLKVSFFQLIQFSALKVWTKGIQTVPYTVTIEFFTLGLSDAFLSDYLTDLKLHKTKNISSKIAPVAFEFTTSGSSVSCSANELSHYLVICVNQQGVYKVMLYWF